MKKLFFGSIALLLTVALYAQPPHPDGPPKNPPPLIERWRHDSTKLQLYVVLSPSQMAGVKNAFVSFYNDADSLMAKGTEALPPREEMEKIRSKRTAALKVVFSTEQFTRFEVFEKEFMPPPPMPLRPMKPQT